jgi:hypothetical protein
MDFAVTVETTIEMDTKDLDGYAAKLPLRWLDGAFRELRQPNPMSILARSSRPDERPTSGPGESGSGNVSRRGDHELV